MLAAYSNAACAGALPVVKRCAPASVEDVIKAAMNAAALTPPGLACEKTVGQDPGSGSALLQLCCCKPIVSVLAARI
jgi:hypothetical protein